MVTAMKNFLKFKTGESPDVRKFGEEYYLREAKIWRPFRICGVFSIAIALPLVLASILNDNWVYGEGFRNGMWNKCFQMTNASVSPICIDSTVQRWQNAVIGLMIFSASFGFIASILAVCGVCTSPLPKKIYYFHSSGEIFLVCAISTGAALIIYPVAMESNDSSSSHQYGPGYGLGWGSAFFFLAAAFCMSLDDLVRESLPYVILLLFTPCLADNSATVPMTKTHAWSGNFEGHFILPITHGDLIGWEAIITFNIPVTNIQQYVGTVKRTSSDNKIILLVNRPDKGIVKQGNSLDIQIGGRYTGSTQPTATADIVDLSFDSQVVPTVVDADATKYNYDEVLMKSIMFYEAQRSGKLPANNRIPWRGDSALHDQGDNGEDLTGGWYDAGDHVKFGFPMAASTTLLAWGLLEYKDAYEKSGQLEYMYDCIRWPLEWMLKCHTGPNELYVQVGDGGQDHGFWGRPEDMTMSRPAFKITASRPGSDIAAEYAAAFAVSYLVFKEKDPAFATKMLTHAKQLYDFAVHHKARYSDSVNQAAAYYRSDKYEDELTWGAAWLYRVTNDTKYLNWAEQFYITGPDWGQSWDDKYSGNMILLYNMTGKDIYKNDIEATFNDWMPGGSIPYSPKGMAFRSQWGALRYTSNMAFMALLAADVGIHPDEYRHWARTQIGYALGDSGRSFVVGFGTNPPKRPHHRSSSCPSRPSPCSFADQQQPGPNPHTLYGALVGGPNGNDQYTDDRKDYVSNEVACDYNAGFQSAVAGLKHLKL
ncbi:endoglucanase 4-like [Saccostrea echinata]|uniref:endoglucanase 4-like n=1 Tax=Saccostrea echinata TaxID=191078 RepID=UPI002A83843C|nr:endoglucanase 4-like [Saccostrea echinata]